MGTYTISQFAFKNVNTEDSVNTFGKQSDGWVGESQGREYRSLYQITETLPAELYSPNYIVTSLKITLSMRQESYINYPCTIRLRAGKELSDSYTPDELYEVCKEGKAIPDVITFDANTSGEDRTVTGTVYCTDPNVNADIINYGLAFDPVLLGVSGYAYMVIKGVSIETIYQNIGDYMTAYDLTPASGENRLASQVIELSWKITAYYENNEIAITDYPTNFDVEYSSNGGESWNILHSNQAVSKTEDTYSCQIPADTLSQGAVYWRVRPYADGFASPNYSTGMFYVRVQASTSSVTCNGKPLPTVSWTSSAQVAYQVRFSDYDSGARYGTETSFTIPFFYTDGYYPVQVRTQASDGTWSAWTELEYVQLTNATPSNTITLTAVPTRHAVVLNWTDSGTSEAYIVYRNNIPIYVGTDTSYTDIAANGECTYYVRAIQPTHYYSQSNSVTLNAYPKTDCLYDFSSMQWIPLKFSLQERSRNYSSSADVIFKNYAGRTKPVAFTSGHTVRQMSGSYVFKTREEALRLRNTAGKTVIFKDTRGGTIIGILNNPDITVQRKLYAVTFLVTETDYIEEREYASE